MRLLLLLREINWTAVIALLILIAAPIVTQATAPDYLGISLGISAVALAVLAKKD